jgi:hypothetical protein
MRIVLSLDLFCIPRAKALGIQNKSRDSTILMFPQDTGLFINVVLSNAILLKGFMIHVVFGGSITLILTNGFMVHVVFGGSLTLFLQRVSWYI